MAKGLGGGYIGSHDILSTFLYLKFHNENNLKKKQIKTITNPFWEENLNLFVFASLQDMNWLLTLFGLTHQGFHDKILEDCDTVLSLNASNYKALYRKSKALSDLGRFREAYDAVAKCSLAVPQVWYLCSNSFVYILAILLLLCRQMASKSYVFQLAVHLLQLGINAHKASVLTRIN